MPLHEALKPIAWLSGRWSTKDGHGMYYPDIPSFRFHDEMEFLCIGRPMFNFTLMSKHPENQTPMHKERGFLRIKPGTNELTLVVRHNFGSTSIELGHCSEETNEIVLENEAGAGMPLSKALVINTFKRVIKLLSPQILQCELFMETYNTDLSEHLKAIYTKVEY